MGQLTVTQTGTHAFGTPPIIFPMAVRDLAATTATLHFENQDAAAQGFSARLYWTATPTFDFLNQVGAQVAGNHAYLAPVDVTYSLAGVGAGYLWGFWAMDSPFFVGTLDYTLFDDLAYCGYGTRVKPSVPYLVQLAPAILTTIVAAVTDGWGWPVAALFLGSTLDVQLLCSTQRPDPVDFTTNDLADALSIPPSPFTGPALQKAFQWLRWAAWPQFCECTPGTPTPHNPPPIIAPPPTGAPPGPLVNYQCDNNDLCTQLQQVLLSLSAIAANQQREAAMVQLIQRQEVPFAYVYGASHGPLVGQGEFAVQGILGLAVSFSVIPPVYPPISGDPTTYHQIGKITVGTADGWQRSWMPTHSPYLILPISGAVTKVGWTFPAGVIATITELIREP